MFKKKDKREIFDDEVVVGKIKRRVKKRNKAKIRNDYYIDDKDMFDDNDIGSKIEQRLKALENFVPSEETSEINLSEELNKDFPFTKEEVFGVPTDLKEKLDDVIVDKTVDNRERKPLSKFFDKDKKITKKLKDKDKTPQKKPRKKSKKGSKEISFDVIKEGNIFKLGKRKFSKVEDFIKYLTENYLEIDAIAKKVLADEKFHGWVSKKSGVYRDAFQEFKDIKAKIEK